MFLYTLFSLSIFSKKEYLVLDLWMLKYVDEFLILSFRNVIQIPSSILLSKFKYSFNSIFPDMSNLRTIYIKRNLKPLEDKTSFWMLGIGKNLFKLKLCITLWIRFIESVYQCLKMYLLQNRHYKNWRTFHFGSPTSHATWRIHLSAQGLLMITVFLNLLNNSIWLKFISNPCDFRSRREFCFQAFQHS